MPYIVFDFETGSKNAQRCQPIQLAAIAVDGRKLERLGKFSSFIKPVHDKEYLEKYQLDPIYDEALQKTKITLEQIDNAPEPKVVWKQFVDWVNQFNFKKSKWGSPIKCGFNNNGYDDIIVDRLCGKPPYEFGPWNEEYQKEDLFNPVFNVDLLKLTFYWMESNVDMKNISMDALRAHLGLSNEAAHNAVFDVEQESEILIRYLKLARHYGPKIKFKNSMASWKPEV